MIGELNDFIDLIGKSLQGLGIENWLIQILCSILALIFCAIIFIKQFQTIVKYFVRRSQNKKLKKDLHPFYSHQEIKDATKFFINTRFQNVPPSEDEEPSRNYIAAAKNPLIPKFIDELFDVGSDDNKYYLILADSGMGKTTFMINLFLKYKYKFRWFWEREKFNILLLPLGNPESYDRIKGMSDEEKEKTIILLDAFDEDNKAVEDYKKRVNELLKLVWNFREVVITCRTQFFPSSKEEPAETGRYKFGPKGGEYSFQKIYVSTFTEKDIKEYLRKKFRTFLFFINPKHLKAQAIVLKSPNLMMRPMLLSHIDDLVKSKSKMKFGFEVYSALIEQWLIRESNKSGIQKKYGDKYKAMLYNFSKALAIDLYTNRDKRNNKLSLGIEELIKSDSGLQLKDIEGNLIGIDKNDQSSRSLLNRNAIGEYKFSHKSILEYFIALEAYENKVFRYDFIFDKDLDAARTFFIEMLRANKEKISNNKLLKMGFHKNELLALNKEVYFEERMEKILRSLIESSAKDLLRMIALTLPIMFYIIKFFPDEKIGELDIKYRIMLSFLLFLIPTAHVVFRYLKVKRDIKE